jgi:YHS domain-containing protein
VSFQGVTYYVCCSGCLDAFNENPAKIVAAYLAKKKKK